MDNTLIDDRRIHVDFSQSVAKLWKQFRLGKRSSKDGCFKCGAPDHIARYCNVESEDKQQGPKYILKASNTQHGGEDNKSYGMLFDEENADKIERKQAKKIKIDLEKLDKPRYLDHDTKDSDRHRHAEDRSRRHREDEKEKPNGREDKYRNECRIERRGDRDHYRRHDNSKQRIDEGDYRRPTSNRDGKDALHRDKYRNDEGDHGKRRAEMDRYRRDDRSFERSRDRDDESFRERRHRDGWR